MTNDDTDGITLQGESWTVSATEKISTGDYENYSPHITIEGTIPAPESSLDLEARAALQQELLALHGDLQAVLKQAAGNRIADPEFEDWNLDADPVATDGGTEESP